VWFTIMSPYVTFNFGLTQFVSLLLVKTKPDIEKQSKILT